MTRTSNHCVSDWKHERYPESWPWDCNTYNDIKRPPLRDFSLFHSGTKVSLPVSVLPFFVHDDTILAVVSDRFGGVSERPEMRSTGRSRSCAKVGQSHFNKQTDCRMYGVGLFVGWLVGLFVFWCANIKIYKYHMHRIIHTYIYMYTV